MSFTFSQLLDLPVIEGNRVDPKALKKALPKTPEMVLKDVYSDHGRKEEFQIQYSNIELDKIRWQVRSIEAIEIVACSYYDRFEDWIKMVSLRPVDIATKGWNCIETRKDVRDQWKTQKTWLSPPYFINGYFTARKSNLHLMEGHTRVGLLKGFVEQGIIKPDSIHTIWLAC